MCCSLRERRRPGFPKFPKSDASIGLFSHISCTPHSSRRQERWGVQSSETNTCIENPFAKSTMDDHITSLAKFVVCKWTITADLPDSNTTGGSPRESYLVLPCCSTSLAIVSNLGISSLSRNCVALMKFDSCHLIFWSLRPQDNLPDTVRSACVWALT